MNPAPGELPSTSCWIGYQKAESALQAGYQAGAAQYRKDDEIEVASPYHERIAGTLARICGSFSRPISVLDIGCGTGRYFYCLQNVERLVGMDISDEMLIAAENPVNAHRLTAQTIQLIRGNVFVASFDAHSFDFIYSLGMFGHGCPVTAEVLEKFYKWLRPGGQLFFDVVDLGGLRWTRRWKKRVRNLAYPLLPRTLQERLDERAQNVPFFGMTHGELDDLMARTRFPRYSVTSENCDSPLWNGRHLECWASAPPH